MSCSELEEFLDIQDSANILSAELVFYLEKTLNQTHTDVSLILRKIYKDVIVFDQKNWYSFRDHCWIKHPAKESPVYRKITKELVNYYLSLGNYYNRKASQVMDHDEVEDIIVNDFVTKAKLCSELCIKLTNNSNFNRSVNKICEKLFQDLDFHNKLDTKINLIGFQNGVYDCDTGKFRDGRSSDLVHHSTGYDYLEDSKYQKTIRTFVETILKNNSSDKVSSAERFWKYMSQSMNGNSSQPLFIWTGPEKSKRLLIKLLGKVFGDYFGTLSSSLLRKRRLNPNIPYPELLDNEKRRLCIAEEDEITNNFNMSMIRDLASHEQLWVKPLYKDARECLPQFSLIYLATDVPKFINQGEDSDTWVEHLEFKELDEIPEGFLEKSEANFDKWRSDFMSILIKTPKGT